MEESFEDRLRKTRQVIAKFQKAEQKPWGAEGAVIELAKQVGDLSKLIMIREKFYVRSRQGQDEFQASDNDIADELFDIWFCLVRIADHYKIDIGKSIDQITQTEMDNFMQGKIN